MTRRRATVRLAADQRADTIVRAAIRLFAGQGYGATSVEDIVAAAGVTKPILYRHFASKRVLGQALLERCRHELVMAPLGEFQSMHQDPRSMARRMVGAWFDHVIAHPDETRLLFTPFCGDEVLAGIQSEIQARGAAMQAALLRETAADLDESHLEALGEMLRAALSAGALYALDHPDGDLTATREAVITMVDRLIAPCCQRS